MWWFDKCRFCCPWRCKAAVIFDLYVQTLESEVHCKDGSNNKFSIVPLPCWDWSLFSGDVWPQQTAPNNYNQLLKGRLFLKMTITSRKCTKIPKMDHTYSEEWFLLEIMLVLLTDWPEGGARKRFTGFTTLKAATISTCSGVLR